MKFLMAIFLLLGIHSLSAQTELINHKSHSGTNRTFKVAKGSGNFGLSPVFIHGELERDSTSSYKLIFNKEGNSTRYILFKTENKALDNTMCMANDEVIQSVTFIKSPFNLLAGVEKLLIEELRNYRKLEKK